MGCPLRQKLWEQEMKRLITTILFTCLISRAFAGGGGVTDPIEYQNYIVDQITSVKSAASLLKQAEQVENQLQMIQNQVKNLSGFKNLLWDNTSQSLQQLANVVNQGQALSYSMQNLGSVFKEKYPGYVPEKDYSQAYQNWSQTALDTLQGTLQSAGLQAQQFNTEQGTIEQLREMAKTETGRQQALEVGNQIAGETVNQMQNLRQLIVNQTNAQNAYMAYKVQEEQAKSKAQNQYIDKADDQYPEYQNNQQFGAIPDFNR